MDKREIISLLDDNQIDELLKFVPEYSDENSDNIKNKFYKKIKNKARYRIKRPSIIAASIALVIVLSSGLVYAGVKSGVIDLNAIYTRIFGDNADYMSQYAKIIEGGSEYDGIKLDLLSAVREQDKLVVYFTLTDLTGDRLKNSSEFFNKMDVFRSLRIDSKPGYSRLLNYDEKTKTATFEITSSTMYGVGTNDTATINLKYFLSGFNYKSNLIENQLDIYSLISNNEAESIPITDYLASGYGFDNLTKSKYADNPHRINILMENNLIIPFSNIDWSKISNIGFIDGELHIKTVLDDDSFNNINSLSFIDKNGNKIYTNQSDVKYLPHPSYYLNKYHEFIFEDINDISQIKDLKLCLDVSEYGEYIEGNWEAKFTVPSETKKIETPVKDNLMLCDKEVFVDKIVLSPLRISIYCKYYESKNHTLVIKNQDVIKVMYKNGTIVDFPYTSLIGGVPSGDLDIFSYDLSGDIIRIEDVKSIIINGKEILVN
ncbi:MAG: hypothetical protein FWC47_16420 [Oscillospiraceae bacterium]|nr:hypothetical protein [Oscillospiraceae bacterium]